MVSLLSQSSNTLMYPTSKRLPGDGISDLPSEGILPLTCLELVRDGECRWPIDALEAEIGVQPLCGRECKEHSVYCPDHHKRAYVRPKRLTERASDAQHINGVNMSRKNKTRSSTITMMILHTADDLGL